MHALIKVASKYKKNNYGAIYIVVVEWT